MLCTRKCQQYLKVIVITSLCWCFLDVFLLTQLNNCNTSKASNGGGKGSKDVNQPVAVSKKTLLDTLIDKVPEVLKPSEYQPGDGGSRVNIPTDLLEKSKESFKINQFNLVASDLMSLDRKLPDYRTSQCLSKSSTYPLDSLPDTSVIIVFHNEAWSTLLRTVHSVINRSPHHLIKEIIMVDDASDQDHLKQKLDDYVKTLAVPVNILRIPTRGGLIRARLKGAKAAVGKVLTFLDAHCECTDGWLEPLLYEIFVDRTAVVCPIIDVISDDDFSYITGSDMTWGGFNWKLNFRWYTVPQRENLRRNGDHSLPLRSPTMAGGLFSIERNYFYEIGSYDSGMNIWGGENLEMSFRIWMCGGQVLIATCSRVGHVFRKVSPYSWPGGVAEILNHNMQRIADVWMDGYKDFFYKTNPGVRNTDAGDMTERHNLRKKLKCKSFKWYLENIYPEANIPMDYVSIGQIKNPSTGECLDTAGRRSGEFLSLYQCHNMGGNQAFVYTKDGNIQSDELCVKNLSGNIKLGSCEPGTNEWQYIKEDKQIKSTKTGMCMAAVNNKLSLEKCILGKPVQLWILESTSS